MKILGRAYKENLILGIIMAIVAVGLFVALGIILFDTTLARIIVSALFFAFALFCFVFFLTLIILQLLTADIIISFSEQDRQFIINGYRKTFKFTLNDLAEISYYNKGLLSFGAFIFRQEFEYGKICFRLLSGKKIVTPNIENIKECYSDIDDLINKNREEQK